MAKALHFSDLELDAAVLIGSNDSWRCAGREMVGREYTGEAGAGEVVRPDDFVSKAKMYVDCFRAET